MEQLIANLVGKTRRATLNGRDYIVAPLSLIVTGVLNGSKGALFYPSDEIGKDPQRWNHTPIVVYHPVVNGQNVSARDPDVLNTSGIGLVLKSHVKNGKLRAEGWFDIDATRRIDPRVLANLEAGRPIELSTGLFTTNETAPLGSNYRGASYDYIARDYVPDHLAILPDQIGACSINDGCGVLVNKTSVENGGIGSGKAAVESSAKLGSEYLLEGSLIADTHLDKPRVSQGSILKAFQENGFVAKNNEIDGVVILASPTVITTKLQGKGWEHSHYQIKDGIRTDALSKGSNKITLTQEGAGKTVALATRQHQVNNGGPGSGPNPGGGKGKKKGSNGSAGQKTFWKGDEGEFTGETVEDGPTTFHEVKMLEGSKSGQIILSTTPPKSMGGAAADPAIKQKQAEWKDMQDGFRKLRNNQQGGFPLHSNQGETMKKLTDDERFDLIEGIVGNCKCKEAEVTTLNELSDETLTVIANKFGPDEDDEDEDEEPVKNEKVVPKKPIKKQPTDNAIPPQFLKGKNKKKPVEEATDDEEAEGEMPVKNQESRLTAEEQEDLAFARSIKLNQKNEKIKTITSNTNNKFTKEQLGAMPLDVLTNMALLAAPSEEEVVPTSNRRRSNYQGAAAAMSPQDRLTANAERDKEDVASMRPPVINYAELAKEHRQNDIGRQRTVSSAAMN